MGFAGGGRPRRTQLLRPPDIDALGASAPEKATLCQAVAWMGDFLSADHPDIGRSGVGLPLCSWRAAKETLLVAVGEAVIP
jgi:hypothetical protein